jgi:uncharacterized protein (DUF427 family)
MADHIKITPADGTYVIRADGAVLGETSAALALTEGDLPAVIYFPRSDIAMAFLDPSGTTSTSEHKGRATHFSIIANSGAIRDAAWSYEDPNAGAEAIRGYLAFDPDKVEVEEV